MHPVGCIHFLRLTSAFFKYDFNYRYPPIITIGNPTTMLPPCAVVSPILAAGFPPIITVADPLTIESGGPTHTRLSPSTAAGKFPMSTVGMPGPMIGPPTWGMGGTPGVCIGQVCMSRTLDAGGIFYLIDNLISWLFQVQLLKLTLQVNEVAFTFHE